jgi:hypothetical protein
MKVPPWPLAMGSTVIAQAQEAMQWVKPLREKADADMVHRRIFRKFR